MNVDIQVVPITSVANFINSKISEQNLIIALLFGGDRFTCCDEAVIAYHNGEIISLATIAPKGEVGEGPAIVGLFTIKTYRRKGIGKAVLTKAVSRCKERNLVPVRISTLSTNGAKRWD